MRPIFFAPGETPELMYVYMCYHLQEELFLDAATFFWCEDRHEDGRMRSQER